MTSANRRTEEAKNRSRLTLLLISSLVLALGVMAGLGVRFILPEERVLSAGFLGDYDWREPEYVPLEDDLIV